MPTAADDFSLFLNELGRQHVQNRDLEKAFPLLEQAYLKKPDNSRFGLDYCQLLLQKKEYAKVKAIALPLVEGKSRFEFSLPLAPGPPGPGGIRARRSRSTPTIITHFGANINVFNQIGECFLQLGDAAEALKAWEKSLALNPKQPRIKEKVDGLKKSGK